MHEFSDRYFDKFSKLAYDNVGIYFSRVKEDMLKSKIDKLMLKNSISSYGEYFNILATGSHNKYMTEFTDEITINKTDFFREINHFDFIKKNIDFIISKNIRIRNNLEIRIWSSACSTGQEAYTIAIVLKECMPEHINIKILATDVCTEVLGTAQKGFYSESIRSEVEPYILSKYFVRNSNEYQIIPEIRNMVVFRQFNLMNEFPFNNKFDIIFCRNVMIYFDSITQQKVLDKMYNVLASGGLLFIGHSESLINKTHSLQYIQPTVYIKEI